MAASRNPLPPSSLISIPKSWLIGLGVLFIAPWLIAAGIYARGTATEAPGAAAPLPLSEGGGTGPWGQLTITPIVISPPLEYISDDEGAAEPIVWRMPNTTSDVAASFLAWSGMPATDAARLLQSARPDPSTAGIALFPDAALLRSLTPEVRARLYLQLAKSRFNSAQAESYRFLGASAADWFAGSLVSPRTRQIIEPLVYRDGPFLHFADLDMVKSEISDEEEWHGLRKALMRNRTVLVRLNVEAPAEVEALTHYWGISGRRTDIRPLLESIAGAGPAGSIDVVHLLPALARNLLYRYPKLSAGDLDKPIIANCLWSSLNFFAAEPDDRFLDVTTALNTLKSDYYLIESGHQLGDVIAFLDGHDTIFHAAVYLADGLAFTKNGTSPMAPWTIMSVDNIKAFYRARADNPRLIYHRRKDL
ncbi:MAG: hypothetical protein WD690_15665 [Vicinamibacterales bacterium]